MIINLWLNKDHWKKNGTILLVIGRDLPGPYLTLWMSTRLRSCRKLLSLYKRMIMKRMKDSRLNRIHLDWQNMGRLKRQKGGEEKCLTNKEVTINCKRYICRDSQRKKVTKTFLPLLNRSNTTFDHNNFYYFF